MKDLCLLLTTVVSLSLINCEDGLLEENLQINLTQTVNATNGHTRYELTCAATGVVGTLDFAWLGVTCQSGAQTSTCTFTSDSVLDNVRPACAARCQDSGQTATKPVLIDITYPQFQVSRSDVPGSYILHTDDVVTCTIPSNNTLVGSVHFACTDPQLDDQSDVSNETSVSSSVTVNVAHVTEKDTTCICDTMMEFEGGYYHMSTADMFSIEHRAIVKSLRMNNTDKEITVNGADRATLNVVCEAFGRPKPEQFNMTKVGRDSYSTNATEAGKWMSQAAVTLSDIQCRDMGTYSCTAHNGLGHPDTRSIMLNVRCPPKKTFNETLNMTVSGIVFTLEAFPAPDKFAFTHMGTDTRSNGTSVLSDFDSTCQQDRVKAYMVQCVIIPVNVPKRLLGLYRVDVSNGIGSVEVVFQIRTEVLNGKSTSTGLIVGCVIIVILVVLVSVFLAKNRRRIYRRMRTSTRTANRSDAADNTQYLSLVAASAQASNRSTQSQAIDVSRYRIDPSTNPGNSERIPATLVEGSSRASPIDVKPSSDVACTSVDVNVDCTNIAGQEKSKIVTNSQDKSAIKRDNDTVKEPKDICSSNGNHDIAKGKTDNSASKADNGTPNDKYVSNDTTVNGASKGENSTAKGTEVFPSSKEKSQIYNNDTSPACISRPEEPKAQPKVSTTAKKKPSMYKNDVSPPCTARPTEPQAQPKVHDYANEEPVYTEIDDVLPAPALKKKQGKVEALYAVTPCYGTPGYKDPKSPGHVKYQEPWKLTIMKNDTATNRDSSKGGDLSTSTRFLQLPTQRASKAPGNEGDTYDIASGQRPPSDPDDTYSHID